MRQAPALDVLDLEILMWNGIFSSSEGLLAFGYVVCMFLTTTYRPQQIGSIGLFRLSYILFALYLVIPGVSQLVMTIVNLDGNLMGGAGPMGGMPAPGFVMPAPGQGFGLTMLVAVIGTFGKVLFCFAIVCGLASLRHYPPAAEQE